ncbi:MAG TPA: chorismate synthase [Dongiaceae bacterium]|nr:chorismate synthase [Dongiaceae bacterium]
MSHNSFGHLFRFTTWGESHGPAIGCVVDGTPPGIALAEPDIQGWLDKRKPGQSRFVTQRRESDTVEILSGVFDGETTGTPISLMIKNEDQRSKDYSRIKDQFRPGHADFTYWAKYRGIRDYRGGGRSSARETASRVAAGAVARKVLAHLLPEPVEIRGALIQIGTVGAARSRWDWAETERNSFWSPDADVVPQWEELLDKTRKAGSSVGAVVEVVASGVPVGLGAPIYGKLDSDLAAAMMGINAVKGVEIGAGFAAAVLSGEENADQMRIEDGKLKFLSNMAGGILGGISTGQDVVVRFAVKPTSSINQPRKSITTAGEEVDVATTGRHDPCVGIRAVPVGEAMMAVVLADHLLRHRAQCGVE